MRAWFLLLAVVGGRLSAQATLGEVARAAQAGWLAHDPEAVMGQSATVVLQIPGANPSGPLGRAQAIELLRRYLRAATERALGVRTLREVAPGSGLLTLDRAYAVRGTKDLLRETIFLRFQRVKDHWELTELRSGP